MDREFIETFPEVDVGLHPDVIRNKEAGWIGFYSESFLDRIREKINGSAHLTWTDIECSASVLTFLGRKVKTEAMQKDIYGTGNLRNVERSELGVRKFRMAQGGRGGSRGL
jgi:hypothetical protein